MDQSAVLSKASEMLIRHGPARVSVRDVAEAVGLSRASIQKRWPTRAEFLLAVLQHERKLVSAIWEGVDESSTPEDLMVRMLSTYQSNPRWYKLLGRMALEEEDGQVKDWVKSRIVFPSIRASLSKLATGEGSGGWTPEALTVTCNLLAVALPIYGPIFMEWYGFEEKSQHQVEGEVLRQMANMILQLAKPAS